MAKVHLLFTPSVMADTANLEIGDQKYSLNLIKGTEDELAVDISKLRKESRVITLTMVMEIQVPGKRHYFYRRRQGNFKISWV